MYVDDGGGGDASSGASLWDSMQGFFNAASSGEIEVSESAGQAMLDVIKRFKQGMMEQEDSLRKIATSPPLGRLKGGEVMAPFMVQVATDENGFITRFNELRESLTKAEEAIRKSMENYRATEEATRLSMNRLGGELE